MKEVFEKVINEIEKARAIYFLTIANTGDRSLDVAYEKVGQAIDKAIKIVKQLAEQFGTDINVGSNGWIPVEEEFPKTDEYILLSFSNFSIPLVGRYEEDENGGAFYVGDETEPCVKQDIFVNAWMHLPTPYQPKGE